MHVCKKSFYNEMVHVVMKTGKSQDVQDRSSGDSEELTLLFQAESIDQRSVGSVI